MAVGTVELHLPDVGSLKGKRHVLKGLKEKVRARFEVAVAEGELVTWERAKTMPTRLEAIGELVAMILGPGGALAGCLMAPGGAVASQIESKSKEETPAA